MIVIIYINIKILVCRAMLLSSYAMAVCTMAVENSIYNSQPMADQAYFWLVRWTVIRYEDP